MSQSQSESPNKAEREVEGEDGRALGLFELLFINRHARTIKCISLELGLTKGPWACRVCVCVCPSLLGATTTTNKLL